MSKLIITVPKPAFKSLDVVRLNKEAAGVFSDFMELYASQGGKDSPGKMASKMILYAVENAEFAGEDERQCRE